MRILLISDHADPLAEIGSKEAGGQNIYVLYLAKFLSRLGVFVDVFTRLDRKNKKEVVKLNNYLRIIRVKAGPKHYIPRDNFLELIDEFASNILQRIKREKIKYDLIHSNYWFSGLIGLKIIKKIKIPLVHTYHSIGKVRFDALKKFKIQKSDYVLFQKRILKEKEIAKKAKGIIATSPIEKQIIKKLFKTPGKKIKMIPIGVDKKVFYPIDKNKARRALRLSLRKKIIIYVGRIEWRKGIGTLLFALFALKKIVKQCPDSHLYIIGGGRSLVAKQLDMAEQERLLNIANELNLKNYVFFLGPKQQRMLYKYYSAADVVVVPSYYEPFGIVPLEAMACGTPVVASKTGGLKFTVKDGLSGYQVRPRDYKDLAEKIIKILKKGKSYFKTNCIERVNKKFSWEKISKQYYNYFQELINKK